MKLRAFVATAFTVAGVQAADPSLDDLKQQLNQLRQQVQELQQQVERLENQSPAPAAPTVSSGSPTPVPLLKAGSASMNISLVGDVVFGWSTEPDVEALNGAHHDPSQRGFSLTSAEVTFEGAVDPYFQGLATLTLVLEPSGETAVELEEAWLQTSSLPANLQLRAGQMFVNFGRQNTQHSHTWAFVDQPVTVTRLLGGDGLRNVGAQLAWLAPVPAFTELTLSVFNGDGETAAPFDNEDSVDIHGGTPVDRTLRGPQDLLYVPRVATSFNLTDEQTLLTGLSAGFGPNSAGTSSDTQLYGADIYWKWRPADAQAGFPFVGWQTEFIYRRYDVPARIDDGDGVTPYPAETLGDWGFYSQLLWGFRRGWVAGLRGEFVSGDAGAFASEVRLDRTRVSPNLTWYPTEFSKLRLQYNYDPRQRFGDDHSIWFQMEFLLGAHAAHKF
jgi:outer membrane murein-binding lipoprotein Lpp